MEKKLEIGYSQTDYTGTWKLNDIFNQFAELATIHASSFGGWRRDFEDTYGWIISKMRVKIYQPARFGDEVTLKTWVSQGTHVVYPRHFEIYNSKNELIGEATSNWTLLDLVRRRIAMPKRVGLTFPSDLPEHGNIEIETDFSDEEGYTFVEKRQVRYGDLDVNGHMNNASYIAWMNDILGAEMFKDYFIADISVQYKKETAPNAWLSLEKKIEGDHFKVRGLDEDGQIHFVAEGLWKKY